ncbi:hypothetical protein [Clostridium diolis]|nr:hypothetical protein [Clostridium diolis]
MSEKQFVTIALVTNNLKYIRGSGHQNQISNKPFIEQIYPFGYLTY